MPLKKNILSVLISKGAGEKEMRDIFLRSSSRLVTFINPVSYILMRKKTDVLDNFDHIFFDGIVTSLFMTLLTGSRVERISFDMTALAPRIFSICSDKGLGIYFLGARWDELTQAVENFKREFPGLNVVGFRDGFVSKDDWGNLIRELNRLRPDVLVVGMGCSLQEETLVWLHDHLEFPFAGFTCGGFLGQSAAGVQYYPPLINKLDLRWAYRLVKEPHYRRRFLPFYSKFPFVFVFDFFSILMRRK